MRKFVVIVPVLLFSVFAFSQAQDLEQNDSMAQEVIGRLNAWRLEEGVWPLKPNATLTELALYQANYLVSLPSLPDDLHIGPQGREPRVRAIEEPFSWPHYSLPGQVAIGENAARGNVNFAMNFWRNSELHKTTALNPAYREVGVAVLPYKGSFVFIAVFGARPNVLPALVDPRDNQTIYLSNEVFEYAQFYDAMQTAAEVQLFDADGRPVHEEALDWTEKLAVPTNAGNEIYLLLNDADDHTVISPIDLDEDLVVLPAALMATVAQEPTSEPTAVPTEMPVDSGDTTTETPADTASPPATDTETVEEPPVEAEPSLRILYNSDTLDVINVSGEVADWRVLEFVGTIDYPFTQWERVTVFPLGEFPANHCLQIRSTTITGAVEVPETCSWVRSLIQLQPDRLFWALGDFEVRRNGATLATCEANAGMCDVVLLP